MTKIRVDRVVGHDGTAPDPAVHQSRDSAFACKSGTGMEETNMAVEFMVRYEQAPDIGRLKAQVESCFRDKLALSSSPRLSCGPGLGGEHAHEVNVFFDGDDETRTWLLMGPLAPHQQDAGLGEEWATLASMRTRKSFLLTAVTAAALAEMVEQPILDDSGLLKTGLQVSPQVLLQRLKSVCRGRTFAEAADAVGNALGISFGESTT